MEQGFPPGGADLSDCREPIRSAASLSAEPEVQSVLDGAVPGCASPATAASMAGSLCSLSRQRAQMDIWEQNRELRSQLVEAKQQVLDLREKLDISESTAFSLANQLRKYKCGKFRDVLESVLGVRLDFWEEEWAEMLTLEDELREANRLIDQQARELTRLRQVL
ncbi:putative neuroblastoma breakpoint family member 5 [Lemur catta]|uniref:putative neuroblastoma breakpoint family member 5 n=1 Tax=Lemur catta TaxID=9447 RepID=UPI001E26D03B|nr:putative neuroblastoma breakpoint family member 5 [Lemur catta]